MKKNPAHVTVPHRDNKPNWYCVATKFGTDGKIESEIVADETTKLPIAIEIPDKPLDVVYETATATIYYTYHDSYEEAHRQMEQSTSMVSPAYSEIIRTFSKRCYSLIDAIFEALSQNLFVFTNRRHGGFGLRNKFLCNCF